MKFLLSLRNAVLSMGIMINNSFEATLAGRPIFTQNNWTQRWSAIQAMRLPLGLSWVAWPELKLSMGLT